MRKRSQENSLIFRISLFINILSTVNSLRNACIAGAFCLRCRCSSLDAAVSRLTFVSLNNFTQIFCECLCACAALAFKIACAARVPLRLVFLAGCLEHAVRLACLCFNFNATAFSKYKHNNKIYCRIFVTSLSYFISIFHQSHNIIILFSYNYKYFLNSFTVDIYEDEFTTFSIGIVNGLLFYLSYYCLNQIRFSYLFLVVNDGYSRF